MKLIFAAFLLIFNLSSFAQSNQVVGNYNLTLSKEGDYLFDYKLTLNQDGTFYFHHYKKIDQGIPPEVNKYGKGKWEEKSNVVSFFSDKEKDFDKKYTLDFTGSKARFATKSPRDKTDRIIKTSLRFFESEILWMRRIDLIKM